MIIAIVILICLIAGLLIGYYWCHFRIQPALQEKIELDKQTQEENSKIKQENDQLIKTKSKLIKEEYDLKSSISSLNNEIKILNNSVNILEQQSKQSADIFYQHNMKIAKDNFEQSLEKERQEYLKSIESFEKQLEIIKKESIDNYNAEIENKQQNILNLENEYQRKEEENQQALQELENTLNDLRQKVNSAVQAAKRAEELKTAKDFYRIQLSKEDIGEISKIRDLISQIRYKDVINKIVWKCYYEKPTNDLTGRVVGGKGKIGIYKITNIQNNKCYVGQSVDIAERWKQHIKRGVGADTPTRNKLYPAMQEIGPENFTFELIEECSATKLNEREQYWQEFFGAKEYGYSIK